MDGKRGLRGGLAPAALVIAAVCMATTMAGCAKLKARDHLNQGVNAFKTGNYSQAADEFRLSIDADPTFATARVYLATAYLQQFVPGTETDENKKFWNAAMEEFQKVLKDDPKNLLATQSIANLYYQIKDMPNAVLWNKKIIELDPKNKEAYYTLGVIAWLNFLPEDRAARNTLGMKPDEQAPLKPDTKKSTLKADLKAKYWQPLTEAIDDEDKALAIDPEYENAMSYKNLLIRFRADLEDSKDAYAADVKQADEWMQKALETTKAKAAKKAEALQNGAAPE
jgi:tetratricopeptide (TPR) repeat protein